ncbi:MAG: RagB/SusD family nutrient uptake outer membrane protein [Candidatus Pseudobacter hemicellulosilyticus]|uniref:RagB/SusD family nutrient uptake outer membrane protein n=1 Tax=Candidatus Pseudobacter hemicellulosilyticus TaxID=3121375 RepID=A0AAJ5WP68_9BACT|nr:MAG: RagB/SusD family nutrient uptake outer membrane protein [Pseudobacter sp.]
MSNASGVPGISGTAGLAMLTGLSGDELVLFSGVSDSRLNAYYRNELRSTAAQSIGTELWVGVGGLGWYTYIFSCNAAIEGLSASNALTPAVKQQLLGEARFLRAFFYFYLVNLYGNVPLILTTDPSVNAVSRQATAQQVYEQIVSDLKDAVDLLSIDYLNGSLVRYPGVAERVRPTKWAAAALLARTYLYLGNYQEAGKYAEDVINQQSLFQLAGLDDVFIKGSTEAIWQLQPVKTGRNTEEAFAFVLGANGPTPSANLNPVYLSTQLLNDFTADDQRRFNKHWIDSVIVLGTTYYFPFKYKQKQTTESPTEYLMILRLGEIFLIRAEARARAGLVEEGLLDLNTVRSRAGAAALAITDPAVLLEAVWQERKRELFTEMGHRWLDLKRTNKVNAVMQQMTPLKGGVWQSTDQLYPIPFSDIQKNGNLVQNPGYEQ